jgi:hypothetical protein
MSDETGKTLHVLDTNVEKACAENISATNWLAASREGWDVAAGVVTLALAGSVVQPTSDPFRTDATSAVSELKSFDFVTLLLDRWKTPEPQMPLDAVGRELLTETAGYSVAVRTMLDGFFSWGGGSRGTLKRRGLRSSARKSSRRRLRYKTNRRAV